MENYDIAYEILNYETYQKRLKDLFDNENVKNPVAKHMPIGYSSCGFSIDHYSIGNGPMHIVYLAGAHGNEIIGVDYVTQLMKNIAEGKGEFANFNPDLFTIDFIPCQNPEGFYTTTYALNSVMKNMSSKEIEQFSKDYYMSYRQDDINVRDINYILKEFCNEYGLNIEKELITLFWQSCAKETKSVDQITKFLKKYFYVDSHTIKEFVSIRWNEKFPDKEFISAEKLHQEMFKDVTLDCIPEIDEAHKKLKAKLTKMYSLSGFPKGTLANFFPNADGVNLNDNNEYFYRELKQRMYTEGAVYANQRDNNIRKDIPSPVGMPSKDMELPFEYTNENKALLEFIARQDAKEEHYAFVNCHGTGGIFYLYPVAEDDLDKAHSEGVTRDFTFFINNRIASEYTKETGRVYEALNGKKEPYGMVGHPDRITGIGDLLRKEYPSSFLLELSKMGGNPIGPYGDIKRNYIPTMVSNMNATMSMLNTILELKHLYSSSYSMSYTDTGRVVYGEGPRKRK